ncbi:zinc ribbon-containing protein [Saccharophagus degradans]|uniref:zinc ribbon-containing protein n=1 Tax=Saccharophagus degradans TaxID=86304 RepID=UPI002477D7BB|nr:zinc ribbon-containing protein [Saccharophagus degradans]WGO98037.1 zinc ribbon-containing protein [Saccharophagus degradans]
MSDHDKQEGPAYDRFADKAKEFFAKSSEQSLSSLEKAIESAKEHLIKAGELSQQQAEHFKVFLRRDLEQAAKNVHHWGEVTSEQVKENLKPAKLQAGFLDLTAHLSHSASDLFNKLAEWADTTACYKTGQVTAPGVLRCRQCDKEMHFKKSGNIPPCPGCKTTEFRRVS